MGKLKITKDIRKIILKEKRKNPLFGCRKLSQLLESKYSLSISKSLINKALAFWGVKEKLGRKSEIGFLKKKVINRCGIFILKAAELDLFFPKILLESIGVAFPFFTPLEIRRQRRLLRSPKGDLSHTTSPIRKSFLNGASLRDKSLTGFTPEKLLALVDFFIYSPFFKREKDKIKAFKEKGLWQILGVRKPLPLKIIKSFSNKFKKNKLQSFLIDNLIRDLKEVWALKINFKDRFSIYIDPEFRSLWSNFSSIPLCFSLPLLKVKEKFKRIFKGFPLIIMGVPCFGKFPSSFIQFLKSTPSGVENIEILGKDKKVLERIVFLSPLNFIVGFLPGEVMKRASFQKKSGFFKFKLPGLEEDIYIGEFKIKSTQLLDNRGVIIKNVLIKRNRRKFSSWGLFTNTNLNLKKLVRLYSFSWPYLDESFLRHLKVIEAFSFREFRPFLEKEVSSLKNASSDSFFSVFSDFLKTYVCHKYFLLTKDYDWEEIFKIKGRVSKKTPDFLKIFLSLPSNFSFSESFKQALFFINEADIFWNNRKLLFFPL